MKKNSAYLFYVTRLNKKLRLNSLKKKKKIKSIPLFHYWNSTNPTRHLSHQNGEKISVKEIKIFHPFTIPAKSEAFSIFSKLPKSSPHIFSTNPGPLEFAPPTKNPLAASSSVSSTCVNWTRRYFYLQSLLSLLWIHQHTFRLINTIHSDAYSSTFVCKSVTLICR